MKNREGNRYAKKGKGKNKKINGKERKKKVK
jgi:hypothetical protein